VHASLTTDLTPPSLHGALPISFANDLSYQTGSAHSAQVISELYAAYARLDDGPRVDTDALQQRLGIELMPVSRWVEDRLGYLLRSEEHTSELQSRFDLVCRLLL